jgi:hypothetical protein
MLIEHLAVLDGAPPQRPLALVAGPLQHAREATLRTNGTANTRSRSSSRKA